ncbi:MAG: chemotaxis protein CheW [Thermodesulfovibrionales bacterium]|jgi:purine-binding chemotaxis protein CheW
MDIAKIRKKGRDVGAVGHQPGASVPPAAAEEQGKTEETPESREGGGEREQERIVPKGDEAENAVMELLTFALAQEEYAFRIDDVEEIIKPQSITRIPKTDSFLLGVTSLRGKIIPVIDLKKRLSLDGEAGVKRRQKILILKGPRGTIGAVIDRVIGVIRPRASGIGEPPPHLLETEMRFIEGVVLVDGRFLSIIKTEEALDI